MDASEAQPLAGMFVPLLIAGLLVGSMLLFAVHCGVFGRPRTPYIEARQAPALWKWWMEWWVWLWGPVERASLFLGLSPDAITLASVALTAVAAWLLGAGLLAAGGWLYLGAASLDLVDGRVARALDRTTKAGAFLDSTLDRVGELLIFGALAVHFRTTPALYAALAGAGASVLVSYARARGEALGVGDEARQGGMQRAERVVLTGVPCALAPVADALFGQDGGEMVVGSALGLLAVVTTGTALRRGWAIYRALRGGAPRAPLANVRWLDPARRRARPGR